MKFLIFAAVLLLMLGVDVVAQNPPSGEWRAVLVNPADKNLVWNEVILVLNADGTRLTGTADVGHTALARWPGRAPIQNGKIDGNAFSFEWWGTPSASFGTVKFTGTVDGDRMQLSMSSGSRKYELRVERLPTQ